jgi:hypothetical protein
MLHEDVVYDWGQWASHTHTMSLPEELNIHLKPGGSQTNFQQFHVGFDPWLFLMDPTE